MFNKSVITTLALVACSTFASAIDQIPPGVQIYQGSARQRLDLLGESRSRHDYKATIYAVLEFDVFGNVSRAAMFEAFNRSSINGGSNLLFVDVRKRYTKIVDVAGATVQFTRDLGKAEVTFRFDCGGLYDPADNILGDGWFGVRTNVNRAGVPINSAVTLNTYDQSTIAAAVNYEIQDDNKGGSFRWNRGLSAAAGDNFFTGVQKVEDLLQRRGYIKIPVINPN